MQIASCWAPAVGSISSRLVPKRLRYCRSKFQFLIYNGKGANWPGALWKDGNSDKMGYLPISIIGPYWHMHRRTRREWDQPGYGAPRKDLTGSRLRVITFITHSSRSKKIVSIIWSISFVHCCKFTYPATLKSSICHKITHDEDSATTEKDDLIRNMMQMLKREPNSFLYLAQQLSKNLEAEFTRLQFGDDLQQIIIHEE